LHLTQNVLLTFLKMGEFLEKSFFFDFFLVAEEGTGYASIVEHVFETFGLC